MTGSTKSPPPRTPLASLPGGERGEVANPARGEALIVVNGEALVLRPSFGALVAAEGELGSLFQLVERAAEGRLGLAEIASLFWHLIMARPAGLSREDVGEAVVAGGLARATPVLRVVLAQVLQGRG